LEPCALPGGGARVIEQIRCTRLVGRADELDFLRRRANEARLGRGSLVFINGEAGIGKTRLVDEVIRRAKPALRQAKGFYLEHARAPLGPLADIVQALHAADGSILSAARTVRHVLARLVPELECGAPSDGQALGPRSQYAAIGEMLRRFGERHPALLVIEDAQWADESTTEFLKYFAGKACATSVLLLVVARTEAGSAASLFPVIAELRRQRSVHALVIEPLTPAEMQAFLLAALGSQSLAHEDLCAVHDLADGNPLFAEELVASVLAKRSAPRPLPATIYALFSERIERLDPEDRDILVEAAVIGRRFDPAFLACPRASALGRRSIRSRRGSDRRARELAAHGERRRALERSAGRRSRQSAADEARARSAVVRFRRAVEPRDRRRTGHQRAHRREPYPCDSRQGRRPLATRHHQARGRCAALTAARNGCRV
jgi:hypothetical protein